MVTRSGSPGNVGSSMNSLQSRQRATIKAHPSPLCRPRPYGGTGVRMLMRIGDPFLNSLSVISPSSTHLLQRDRISEKFMHLISRSMLSTE
ncbi:MAG TPA: hypothetical protein VF844_06595, partial [Ktedonobacteraceae bacterium]